MMESDLRSKIDQIVEEYTKAIEIFISNCSEGSTKQDKIIEKNKVD